MKKEYITPDAEIVSFAVEEEILGNIDGSIGFTDPNENWEF